MNVLALIPARGGSKGVPRKNLLCLNGKPMLAYSIEHAQASALVNRIIVSSDSAEILYEANQYGAETLWRPDEWATDTSPDIDAFFHALHTLKETEGYVPDVVVHLRPTTPIRKAGDIDQCVNLLLAHPEADSVRSVSVAKQSPLKMWKMGAGRITPALVESWQYLRVPPAQPGAMYAHELHSMPRQMLPTYYHQNGYIDVIRGKTILEQRRMAGDVVLPFVTNYYQWEIDYPEDVRWVEDAIRRHEAGEDVLTKPEARDAV